MNKKLFISIVFLFCVQWIFAQIQLPKMFSDHMMLQRDMQAPIWGTADPGSQITIKIDHFSIQTIADKNGKWKTYLPKLKAGGPITLKINDNTQNAAIEIKDILVGDVWIASGQSNMEWEVQKSMNAEEEINNAYFPEIRLFKTAMDFTLQPQDDVYGGKWKSCDSSSVKDFSAAAYFFARQLHQDQNVPIGIIQSTWGGTPVEAWTSREKLLSSPISKEKMLALDTITEAHFVKDSLDLISFWDIVYNPKNNNDQIVPQLKYNDKDWEEVEMPSVIRDWNWDFYEGMMWMRKQIEIPKNMRGNDLSINLGHPELNYSLYFNGTEICKNVWNAEPEHIYTIPAKLIKKENIISIRIALLWDGGGLNPPANEMYLTDGHQKISLAGKWKYKIGLEPDLPHIKYYNQYHSVLYNAMINPLIGYGMKGVIWYQGEHNVPDAYDYSSLFPMMIDDWRIRWEQGYFPFLYVQLANYMKVKEEPSESNWALLRESQTKTLSQPNTGMACIIDIGEAASIHPVNKQEVGRRLALLAQKQAYNQDVQAYGPIYKNAEIKENKIIIHFDEIGGGLQTSDNQDLKGFAIAAKDQKFYWAKAEIVGNSVVVSSDQVKNPVAVRYAWADNPICNLINKEGLPAIPFRTDDWNAEEK